MKQIGLLSWIMRFLLIINHQLFAVFVLFDKQQSHFHLLSLKKKSMIMNASSTPI